MELPMQVVVVVLDGVAAMELEVLEVAAMHTLVTIVIVGAKAAQVALIKVAVAGVQTL
jgi:hypothetical protein